MTRSPARLLAAALTAVLAVALAACSSSEQPSTAPPGSAPPGAATFPVTVQHAFGTTTIPSEPKRVVTVGFNDVDFALALGVVPVGVRDNIGEYDESKRPWAQAALNGANPPQVGGNEIDAERVAALQPDLILGIYSFMSQADYDTLSKIAPVVAQPTADNAAMGWQDQTRLTGKVLGRSAQAEQAVADVEARFAKARADNPQFAGKTLGIDFVIDNQIYKLGTDDLRTQVFTGLGLDVGGKGDPTPLSPERISEIDKDAIVVFGPSREQLAGDQLFQGLNAVKNGHVVYLGGFDTDVASALGFGSPLSLPTALDAVVPQLAQAYQGT
ncbi:MAG: ABC transporter substrate-binding protein [Pseudonocardia sp. SCN 72-86]|nr:MAG: ABC transporter substrate-binding protein [Pseudonocardia sp. SCN 72-86]